MKKRLVAYFINVTPLSVSQIIPAFSPFKIVIHIKIQRVWLKVARASMKNIPINKISRKFHLKIV